LIKSDGTLGDTANTIEFKHLEYQERECERENQLKIKELELKEK